MALLAPQPCPRRRRDGVNLLVILGCVHSNVANGRGGRSVRIAGLCLWSLMPLLASALGCHFGAAPAASGPVTLATTTSTQDSGLLDVLVPAFQDETGIEVKVVAVGSGQALELARRGDADVLLVHSPEAE